MKVWKCAAMALTLCGAALSFFLTAVPPVTSHSPRRDSAPSRTSSSSSSSNSSSSSSPSAARQRRARATDGVGSILSEFMQLFQSFTEGELRQVVGGLVERQRQARRKEEEEDDAHLGKRTKRAKRKGVKPCSLREAEVTVSQLGLGYDSDETVLFRFCSGACKASRRNYDLILKKWQRKGVARRDRSPCCRPTAYEEDFLFLNNNNRYQKLHEWSALDCGCV